MTGEEFGGLVAKQLHAVAPLDEREAFGVSRSSSTERISLPSCSVWLRRCACSFAVEPTFDPLGGTVEEIDGRP